MLSRVGRAATIRAVLGATAAVAVVAAPGAKAGDSARPVDAPRTPIAGAAAPGPDRYDRVWVRRYGPPDPSCVLVLVPGSPAGQGGFVWIAEELARRVDGLGVWALDRRSNAMEDVAPFERGTADDALGYYQEGEAFEDSTFTPVTGEDAPFVREWGAEVTLEDLRLVIEKASDGGRRCVLLGGHSFGALIAPAYAVWDFHGRAGFRDLDGIVLIDGMLMDAFGNLLAEDGFPPFENVEQARAEIEAFQTQSPFGSDEGNGVPGWEVGVIPELACRYALEAPDAPSAMQQSFVGGFAVPDLPDFPVTNEAFAGMFNDQTLAAEGARVGHLAESGDPRPWVDAKRSGVLRFCRNFTQEPGNGMEWYFPARLEIDLAQGMESMRPDPVTRFLGLRPLHLREMDTPLYAIETRLSDGGVLRAARKMVRRSEIEDAKLVSAPQMKHYDPLISVPSHNRFLKSVVPFLRHAMRP